MALSGPAAADPIEAPAAQACRVSLLPDRSVKCGEPKGTCPCLVVANACPYEVRVYALVDGRNLSTVVPATGKDDTSFCSTKPGIGDVQDIGWLPTEGNPSPGQPLPSR